MALNDTLNELGMAVHGAAQASQKLEKELREAADRVATLNDKNEKVKELQKKVDALSQEIHELTVQRDELKSGIQSLVASLPKV